MSHQTCPCIEWDYGFPPKYDSLFNPPPQAFNPTRVQAQLVELATAGPLWLQLPYYRLALVHERSIGPERLSLADVLTQLLMNTTDDELVDLARGPFALRYHEVMNAYEDVRRGRA